MSDVEQIQIHDMQAVMDGGRRGVVLARAGTNLQLEVLIPQHGGMSDKVTLNAHPGGDPNQIFFTGSVLHFVEPTARDAAMTNRPQGDEIKGGYVLARCDARLVRQPPSKLSLAQHERG